MDKDYLKSFKSYDFLPKCFLGMEIMMSGAKHPTGWPLLEDEVHCLFHVHYKAWMYYDCFLPK